MPVHRAARLRQAALQQTRPLRGRTNARQAESLTEQAYRVIEEEIVTLRLKPGDVLSEQLLSATTSIGRTPIREALQRLAREGLITILPRKGILVSDINPRNQLLVLEVRRELERLLSRTGAERATPAQRARLQEVARGMDLAARRNDDIAFMRLDRELNALMIACAHNDYAARSMKLLQGLSRRFWYMHYREAADLPLCARLHANQARAIAKGDAEAAARASDKLMDYVESFTRATVSVCVMGVYEGKRTIDGLVVTVDGKKLDEHYEIKRFTRFGFEWSYEGDSPQQLALAILFDRLGDKERAIKLCEPFMKTVVANLDNDWKLTGEEIDGFVRAHPQPQ